MRIHSRDETPSKTCRSLIRYPVIEPEFIDIVIPADRYQRDPCKNYSKEIILSQSLWPFQLHKNRMIPPVWNKNESLR